MAALTRGSELSERLLGSAAVARVAAALGKRGDVWIVGGAVRGAALGREVADVDLAVGGDPATAAVEIAARAGGHAFELSSEFGTWRVAGHEGGWRIDVGAVRGGGIAGDLAARDFTVGAIAVALGGGEPLDPHGGLDDLEAGVLRVVGSGGFVDDPLRLIRAARIAAELGLSLDAETAELARAESARAGEPAGERQFAELRLLVGGPDPLRGLALIDQLGATAGVLPELEALRGVEQNPNHHLDVHGHTLAVLENVLAVEQDLERFAGDRASEVDELLATPLGDEVDHRTALRFGAIVHDIGKPATRGQSGDHVTFIGHDRTGAVMVRDLCARLRMSRALGSHLEGLTRHHLRLGFLVHERPLPKRRVHEYLRATEPVAAEVTLLTVADRLAARGEGPLASPEMVEAHLELAREMLAAALDWRRSGPPAQLLAGDELAAELGIETGPRIGALLRELEAAAYAGEISSREEAVELARDKLPPQ